jgi:hypothetical protein
MTVQARLAAEEIAKFASLQATHSIVNLYVDARRSLLEHKEIIVKANSTQDLSDSEKFALRFCFTIYSMQLHILSAVRSLQVLCIRKTETSSTLQYFSLIMRALLHSGTK